LKEFAPSGEVKVVPLSVTLIFGAVLAAAAASSSLISCFRLEHEEFLFEGVDLVAQLAQLVAFSGWKARRERG
jgi:hypothetical protein